MIAIFRPCLSELYHINGIYPPQGCPYFCSINTTSLKQTDMAKIAKQLTELVGNTPLLELSNFNKLNNHVIFCAFTASTQTFFNCFVYWFMNCHNTVNSVNRNYFSKFFCNLYQCFCDIFDFKTYMVIYL